MKINGYHITLLLFLLLLLIVVVHILRGGKPHTDKHSYCCYGEGHQHQVPGSPSRWRRDLLHQQHSSDQKSPEASLHPLWRIKKAGLPTPHLDIFHIKSILPYSITSRFEQQQLNGIVKTDNRMIAAPLPFWWRSISSSASTELLSSSKTQAFAENPPGCWTVSFHKLWDW